MQERNRIPFKMTTGLAFSGYKWKLLSCEKIPIFCQFYEVFYNLPAFQSLLTLYKEKTQEHKNISWLLCLHFSLGPSHHLSAGPALSSILSDIPESQQSRYISQQGSKASAGTLGHAGACPRDRWHTASWQQDTSAPDHLNSCSPAGKLVLTSHNSPERESIQRETTVLPFAQLRPQTNGHLTTTRWDGG